MQLGTSDQLLYTAVFHNLAYIYSAYTNSNNALFIDVTNFSILQHRCDVIDFGQTLLYEMCKMRYLTGKSSILLQISRVFLISEVKIPSW